MDQPLRLPDYWSRATIGPLRPSTPSELNFFLLFSGKCQEQAMNENERMVK
jgi:hypothetical protein